MTRISLMILCKFVSFVAKLNIMRTFYWILSTCIFAVSCKKAEPEITPEITSIDSTSVIVESPKPQTDIVPGEKIGNIEIGMDSEKLQFLGTPDLSDAAMGKAWLTWYSANSEAVSGKYELNVFTNYKDDEMKQKVVRLIRVTSPDFHIDSVSTGKTLATIENRFPKIRYTGGYPYDKTKESVELYDDQDGGIAFEFLNDSCIGIIVHPKEEDVSKYYRTFRPDLVLNDF
ncbi:hypothetical protein HUK80_02320 [Flavobacterium sp. MAH-1]|uniref:Uncharacterized protein n=1 Tax=Flavobacterium agri TaxID=2743471 RepID=A0A7Y8XZS8_9FLAO|nr:hypothetical protein [Flavobacterium agri]NUY79716.1 hypothetical protein [Flavobacterium agri]NYA69741.1 hypothetical protein [Flavobacterium agri]